MKKKFAIEALKKIKEISEKTHTLYKLGVDLIEFENGTELLTKSLALLLVGEKDYKEAIDDIDWWLYEDVEKKIYLNGKKTIDVETAEQFVDWLVDWYKKDVTKKNNRLNNEKITPSESAEEIFKNFCKMFNIKKIMKNELRRRF